MRKKNKTDGSTTATIPISELIKAPAVTVPDKYTDEEHVKAFKNIIDLLINKGIVLSRRDLMKKNVIKIDLDFDEGDVEQLVEQIKKESANSAYSVIPCFQEGVYYIKHNDSYFYWVINSLVITPSGGYEIDLTINAYARIINACNGITLWIPLGRFRYKSDSSMTHYDTAEAINDEPENVNFTLDIIMEALNNDGDYVDEDLLQTTFAYIDEIIPPSFKNPDKNVFDSIIQYMFEGLAFLNTFTNRELSKNKPIVDRTASAKNITAPKAVVVEDKQPKKIVRNIGRLKVTSPKAPKLPTEESIRKYKVASWPTRGFVRKYKSGKTVYIRDTIHHRKCFKDSTAPTPTVYVNLRGSTVASV